MGSGEELWAGVGGRRMAREGGTGNRGHPHKSGTAKTFLALDLEQWFLSLWVFKTLRLRMRAGRDLEGCKEHCKSRFINLRY